MLSSNNSQSLPVFHRVKSRCYAYFSRRHLMIATSIFAPEMIKDMGYSAPSAFYRDTLRKKYRENIDFIEVSATHQLVTAWEEANRDKSLLGKSTHTGGKASKNYIVTGETLKRLALKCGTSKGDEIADYYIKVEKLVFFMREYMRALQFHCIEMEKKVNTRLLEDKIRESAELKGKLNRLHTLNSSLVCCKKLEGLEGRIYIIADEVYASQGIFKIGRTKAMAPRMKTHNSDKIIGSTYVILSEFAVQDEVLVEHYIHAKLIHLRVKGETEIFMAPFQELFDIVRLIVDNDGGVTSYVNAAVDVRYNLEQEEFKSSDWMRGIPVETFGPKYYQSTNAIAGKIAVSEMNDDQRLKVAQFAITLYIRAKREIEYILPGDASKIITPKIDIKWSDLFNIVKSMLQRGEGTKFSKQECEWSALFGNALTGAISINYIARRTLRSKTVAAVTKPTELLALTLVVEEQKSE